MAAPPSTTYRGVIDDSQKTVTLAGAVVELVGRPISSIWRRRSAVQTLKERLGGWADEAIDANGRWLQPMLRTAAFEKHLIEEQAHFQPSGECRGTFGWTHLLYALNTRPGRNVLAWRVPTDGLDPANTGEISLDIDGQVLCHIITYLSKGAPKTSVRLSFRTLNVERAEDSKWRVTFVSGTTEELSEARVPFQLNAWFLSARRLKFDKDAVVARYYNTILYGVSDTKAVLQNPAEPGCTLITRTQTLLASIRLLRPVTFERPPYLLTSSWLEEASRVKRRVTTNGGSDDSLIEEIIEAFARKPDVRAKFEGAMWRDDKWEHWVWDALKSNLMFDKGSFALHWTARSKSTSMTAMQIARLVREELPAVLAEFSALQPGTWRHTLSEMAKEVSELVNTSSEWINDLAVVLELTPESELWTADVHVCG